MLKSKGLLFLAMVLIAPLWGQVKFKQAWVKNVPKVSRMTAAFGILKNIGEKPIKIVRAKSIVAKAVELHTHQTKMINGKEVSQMRKKEELLLGAGQELILKSGADHIMFIGIDQNKYLSRGGIKRFVPLQLIDDKGEVYSFKLPVKDSGK
jgi:hypothetical protein